MHFVHPEQRGLYTCGELEYVSCTRGLGPGGLYQTHGLVELRVGDQLMYSKNWEWDVSIYGIGFICHQVLL